MRLWHQDLIHYLPNLQLLGQHRELCALRGLGWEKSHSVVNYIFTYPYGYLFLFHELVMEEMENRGYHIDPLWKDIHYRGKQLSFDYSDFTQKEVIQEKMIYSEHDNCYYQECLDNLKEKGIILDIE